MPKSLKRTIRNQHSCAGIRAHPIYELPFNSSPETPKILRIVAARVRTEQERAKASSSRGFSSAVFASSRGLAESNGQSSGYLPDPVVPEEDEIEEALLENTGLSSSFVTRVEVSTPSGVYGSTGIAATAPKLSFCNYTTQAALVHYVSVGAPSHKEWWGTMLPL